MRVSREEAARNRENVVEVAGRKFREHGYEGIGVAALMEAAGLTHGGFYKQFDDKEALVVEATAQALASNLSKWREVMASAPDEPIKALLRWYLSKTHLKSVGDGCAYAALASEAPRHSADLRRAFEHGLEGSIEALATEMKGATESDGREAAIRTIALMVGSLVLSRAVDGRALAEEILTSSRVG